MSTTTRKYCRAGEACHPRSFEEAADCLGHHSPRTLSEIAERLGRSYNYLKKALSPHADAHPLRGDLLVPLTLESAVDARERNYALLDWMEHQVGRVAFVVPRVGADRSRDVVARAQQAMQEFGELLQNVSDPDADQNGVVNAADTALVERGGQDVIAAVAALVASATVPVTAPRMKVV